VHTHRTERSIEELIRLQPSHVEGLGTVSVEPAEESDTVLQWTDANRLNLAPQAAGLIAGILPTDSATLENNVRKIVEQIDGLASEIGSTGGSWLAPSFAGLGLTTLAVELARRRRDNRRGQPLLCAELWARPASTWLPNRG
jgi:hypothetical protein